jgi:hypothetical protein
MRSTAVAAALTIALSASGAFAQEATQPPQDPQQKPPAAVGEEGKKPTRSFASSLVHNLGDDVKHMPRRNSIYWLAGGSALALVVHPNDNKINRRLEGSGAAETFFKPGKYVGETYTIVGAGLGAYLIGRGEGNGRLQHLGMDELEASILTGAIVEGLKESIRRERPLRSDGTRAGGFSFPSGHATLTFAAATVLQQHLGYEAGIPTYLIASYVAMSRLHDNVHYASDVAFGSALGILIGRSVTWHGRNFYGWNMHAAPMLIPNGSGVIVVVSAPSSVPNR